MTTELPTRRRWFQFRLRTLLIAVLVLSLPLSWLAVRMDRARRQREAVEAIRALGGQVVYDWQSTPWGGPAKWPRYPAWLRNLLGEDFFQRVVTVIFGKSPYQPTVPPPTSQFTQQKEPEVVNDDLAVLADFHGLEAVLISSRHVDDTGLEYLYRLKGLRGLHLVHTKVTRKGVQRFQKAVPTCGVIVIGDYPP